MKNNDRQQLLLWIRSILLIANVFVAIFLFISMICHYGNSTALSALFVIIAVTIEVINAILSDMIDLLVEGLMFLAVIFAMVMCFI